MSEAFNKTRVSKTKTYLQKHFYSCAKHYTSKCFKMSENMMSLKTAFNLNDIKTYLW